MEDVRQELAHRPLVLMAVSLCVGLTAVLHPLNLVFLLPMLVARRPVQVALAFALGLVLAPRPAPILPSARWIDGSATVLNVPIDTPYGLSADVGIAGHKWRATFPSDAVVVRGEEWQVAGVAKPLGEASESLRLRGVEGRLTLRRFDRVAEGPSIWRLADGWRRGYSAFVQTSLPPDTARWLEAFAFRADSLDDEERDAMTRTGTVHLVAASGVHVVALAFIGIGIGSILGAPRAFTLGVVVGVLGLYAMATGLHLPTVRAVLAFAVGSGAYIVRREPDGLSTLALAVLLYLPFDPAAVYGVGLQLSVTVVGMLVLWPRRDIEPARTAWEAFRQRAYELGAVSLIASLAAAPILARYEGSLSLLSVPANLVAVPPVVVAIALSLLLQVAHAGWAMPIIGGLVLFAKGMIGWFDGLPHAVLPVEPFWPYWLVPVYAVWIWFWRPRARAC